MDGEKLTFGVNYGIIGAAEATLEIKSIVYQNTPVWYITSNAKTYPFFDIIFKVRDLVESWWDKSHLRSVKFSKRLSEGAYRQHRIHTYDYKTKTSVYSQWSFKNRKFKVKEISIPDNTQDILSAFYYIRQQELSPGNSIFMTITADGRTFYTEVVVHKRETIESIFGEMECLVVEPLHRGETVFKQSGRILIWLTDDKYKVPLKMQSQISFGAFTAVLKSAEKVPYQVKN